MRAALTNPVPATDCIRIAALPGSRQPVVVCDFDQTVCLGDGPVWAYAEAVGAALRQSDRNRLYAELDAYLGRRAGAAPAALGEPADAYGLVWQFAEPLVAADVISSAHLASRSRLATEGLGVYASPGAAELLDGLAGSTYRVLMSKSPGVGIGETLDRIGLSASFDLVIANADKPRIWPDVLSGLWVSARRLCAIGDHWVNDIDVPYRLGCATVWITGRPDPDRPALLTGPDLRAVGPALLSWVAERSGAATRP